tara:strand:+ start:37 stop:831 length:795 start_codon:yes stop_codon:yes gene_type:complete
LTLLKKIAELKQIDITSITVGAYMINKTRIQPKLLLTAITLLTIGLCVSTHAETASLTVTSVDGRATFDNGSGATAVTEGATLTPGSVISTAEGGEVTLALGNNIGSMVVDSNTTVVVDRLSVEKTGAGIVSDTQIDLRDGSILGIVNKFSSALSKFEVKVPTGVIGIDAGDEQTSYQISTPDRVDVLAGYGVFVYTRDGVVRSVRIGGGNQFNPTTGGITPIAPEVINDVSVKIAALPEGAVTPPTQTFTRPFNFFISPSKQQ